MEFVPDATYPAVSMLWIVFLNDGTNSVAD